MAGRLDGKVVLISGSTGIAAATARLVAAQGGSVFIAGRERASCGALAASLEEQGWSAAFHAGDLVSGGQRAVTACLRRFRRIDGLFNVAGISGRRFGDGPLHTCTLAGWNRTIAGNVTTLFRLTQPVLAWMLSQPPGPSGDRGAILNMASVLAFAPEPRHFAAHAYAASKGAIVALTRAMAAYYGPHKIRVNALAPGLVRTPMSARAQASRSIARDLKTKQPLVEGFISADAVAAAAVFLLSDEARAITGDILTVDAGWSVSA